MRPVNQKRARGNRSGGRRPHPNNANRNYDSNGPDVKIRGSASHIFERYCQLARDASAAGDRIAAENHLQHAEHYYRIMLANGLVTPRQANQRGQNGSGNGGGLPAGGYDEDEEDDQPMAAGGFEPDERRPQQPRQEQPRFERDGSGYDGDGREVEAGRTGDEREPQEARAEEEAASQARAEQPVRQNRRRRSRPAPAESSAATAEAEGSGGSAEEAAA